ncbi:MAG: hypothetical protein KKD77_20990, partial [Gammaproteobacteria bacterium]|nr:hypothetical protein [Gammaproteobacteria bacterium]
KERNNKMQISAEAKKVGKSATVEFATGANLAENVKLFGEQIVNDIFLQQLTVKVQAGIRSCVENGKDPQAWASAYKPGTKMPSIAKDPKAAARLAISQMSDEEKKALIAELRGGK